MTVSQKASRSRMILRHVSGTEQVLSGVMTYLSEAFTLLSHVRGQRAGDASPYRIASDTDLLVGVSVCTTLVRKSYSPKYMSHKQASLLERAHQRLA